MHIDLVCGGLSSGCRGRIHTLHTEWSEVQSFASAGKGSQVMDDMKYLNLRTWLLVRIDNTDFSGLTRYKTAYLFEIILGIYIVISDIEPSILRAAIYETVSY